MNQNSTAAHRPVVLMTTAPDTALWPPDPDRDSDRDATSHPAMKSRHLNPRQMISIPEQHVTVRHPVLKAPPGEMRHTAELVNRPRQTSHHGKSLCTCSRRSAWLSRADHGMTVDSATISPALPQPVLRSRPEPFLRLTGDILAGKIPVLPPAFSPRSHTTPLAHIAGAYANPDCVCVMDLLRKFIDGKKKSPKLPVLLRNSHPRVRLLHCPSGYPLLVCRTRQHHCPARVTTLIRTVSPHTGIRRA